MRDETQIRVRAAADTLAPSCSFLKTPLLLVEMKGTFLRTPDSIFRYLIPNASFATVTHY